MGKYIVKRLLINIPVLLMITIIVFIFLELAPGDMLDFFLTEAALRHITEADIEALRVRLGLHDPPPIRYVKWLANIARGNFGYSMVMNEPVAKIILVRMKNSLILMGTGFFISIIIGVPIGIYVSQKQYSWIDFTCTGASFIALSMPAFIAGIIGMYFFAIKIPIFPAGGMFSLLGNKGFGDLLHHLILPSSILAMLYVARNMRYTRFSMLEVMQQDYIVTARAKGLPERVVLYRHALRNALIPVTTIIGLSIPLIVVGAVFLETIYNWPGMGRLYYNAVLARDYPLVMGANLLVAVIVLAGNLLVDIVYSVLDPRVRFE
jgi:peptide/nickel transport system permease protein